MDVNLKSSIRSIVIGSNFVFGVVLTLWMLFLSASEDRTGAQVFYTSMSYARRPVPSNKMFENTVRAMSNDTEPGVDTIPYIQVTPSLHVGAASYFRLIEVHPQFLFFTSLAISSCFAITTFTFPWGDLHWFPLVRVIIIHVWNLLALIAVVVAFSTATEWTIIPISNLFYSIGMMGLTWLYSYWSMVDSTNTWLNAKDKVLVIAPLKQVGDFQGKDAQDLYDSDEAHTVRKNVIQEFSLTFPLYLASSLLQGNSGMDQWRMQTVFFSSWAFFAIYNIFYRFKTAHDARKSLNLTDGKRALEKRAAANAAAFICFTLIITYVQLILSMGTRIIFSQGRYPFFTSALNLMKVGQFFVLLTLTLALADVIRVVFSMQWMNQPEDNLSSGFRFSGNMIFIVTGSILTKLFYFMALSNSDAWTVVE